MTNKETCDVVLKRAYENKDYKEIGSVIDCLRFKHHKNYREINRYALTVLSITLPEWEEILQEVERMESMS